MSTTESARMSREQVKSHRQSSLIQGNVIAFVFRSIDLQSISASSPRTILSSPSLNSESQTEDKLTSKPEQLLQAFKDANKCSLNTKLVESFNELRLVGWYSTYTLMLSAPNEDIRVLKKAWSQRILRNPVGFILKDVGKIFHLYQEKFQREFEILMDNSICLFSCYLYSSVARCKGFYTFHSAIPLGKCRMHAIDKKDIRRLRSLLFDFYLDSLCFYMLNNQNNTPRSGPLHVDLMQSSRVKLNPECIEYCYHSLSCSIVNINLL